MVIALSVIESVRFSVVSLQLLTFHVPITANNLVQFSGLVRYYRRFVPHCATILQPFRELLCDYTRLSASLAWIDAATEDFEDIKAALARTMLLARPITDALTSVMMDELEYQ